MQALDFEGIDSRPVTPEGVYPAARPGSPRNRQQMPRVLGFLVFVISLVLLFHRPLLDLLRYSTRSEVFSYIPLIPLTSAYFVWLRRRELSLLADGSRKGAWAPLVAGAAILVGGWVWPFPGWKGAASDQLWWQTAAFLLWFVGGSWLFFGSQVVRRVGYPLALLVLMIPPPTLATDWYARFLQHASAEVSYALLTVAGEPVLREGLIFRLSGIVLEVAEECSGIRSSLVLFITSLLAGYLFLSSPRYRVVLALVAIPLGILRNGLRIFLIGMLCAHVDPEMIHSPLHHRGGPLFFALSLLLLFALLVTLRKFEGAKREKEQIDVQTVERTST